MAGATRWRPYEGRNIVGYYEFAIFRGGRIETGIVNYSVIIAGRIEVAPKLQKSKLLLRSSSFSSPSREPRAGHGFFRRSRRLVRYSPPFAVSLRESFVPLLRRRELSFERADFFFVPRNGGARSIVVRRKFVVHRGAARCTGKRGKRDRKSVV